MKKVERDDYKRRKTTGIFQSKKRKLLARSQLVSLIVPFSCGS